MDQYKSGVHQQSAMELMDQIDSHHEQFLAATEPAVKAALLRHIRGYAVQYLCLVPHTKKFVMKETHELLANSVGGITDFDPSDASDAFENLAKYSHNLIEQPWRKEFYRIKLTSGFFIHNIRAHLMNAQDLLVTLKYAQINDTTLELTILPDIKQLKIFSRDCFMASQECLILSKLWEKFSAEIPDYPFSALEAYQTRREVVGNVGDTLAVLLQNARQRQHDERQKMLEVQRIRAEVQRNEEIQRQEYRVRQERQRKEEEELEKEQIRIENELREASRRHVPTERLVDIDDDKMPAAGLIGKFHEETGVRQYPSRGSQIESKSESPCEKPSYETEYQRQFVNRSPGAPSPNLSRSSNVNTNLRDLQDVAFDVHLNQSGFPYSDPKLSCSRSRNVEETLKTFEEKSNRVEEVQNRRSVNQCRRQRSRSPTPTDLPSSKSPKESIFRQDLLELAEAIVSEAKHSPASASSSNSSPRYSMSPSTSSGFKNLKSRQDFPKSSSLSVLATSPSSLTSLKQIRSARDQDVTTQLQSPTSTSTHFDNSTMNGNPLRKTKVPEESVIPGDAEPMELETSPDLNTTYSNYSTALKEKGINDKELNDILSLYGPNRETVLNTEGSWQWTCSACTFKNFNSETSCEMCDRARDFLMEGNVDGAGSVVTKSSSNSYVSAAKKAANSAGRSDGEIIHSMITGGGGSNKLNTSVSRSKSDKEFPPLQAPKSSLSAKKFRAGLGFPDENSNGTSTSTSKSKPNGEKWTCIHCTYENFSAERICEICTNRNPRK